MFQTTGENHLMKLRSSMSRALLILIICLFGSSLQAQRYKERHIRRDIEELAGFENAFIGFALYDPQKEKMLASQNLEKHMTPASNTKLFTYWAAKRALPTTLSALEYQIKGDSLIFWSTGYPLTLHPDHPDSTVIDFLSARNEKLIYWPRPIEDDRFGPGWGWDDFNGYYGAEKSVFPIYGNSITYIIDNQKKEFSQSPMHKGLLTRVSDHESNRSRINRDEFWNDFEIQYDSTIDFEAPIDTLIRPFRYSDQLFVELLSEATGKEIQKLQNFERPTTFNTVPGVAADSLYQWMLQPSDNLFAESLLLMISGLNADTLSTKEAILKVNKAITEGEIAGFDERLLWKDGSGLSRYNMFKPKEIIGVLSALYAQVDEELLFHSMAKGGISGTIEDWYAGPEGEPYIFAKTGTLSNNHSLSGYIKTRKGKTLIFSLIANHYTSSTDQIRSNFEKILAKVWAAY